jgi:hypothetical protein
MMVQRGEAHGCPCPGWASTPLSQPLRDCRAATANEETFMRRLLLILGLLALALGLLWIGQGTGVVNWPASSFMIKQIQWAGYGAALAALGLILVWQSRR